MLARYGVDPHTCTLRRLHVLLRALPPGYWPETDSPASWTVEAHLLAGAIDAINNVAWSVIAVNSKRRPKTPKPVARPGEAAKRKVGWGDLADMLGGAKNG